MKKRILCFGDSNTWGYNPVSGQRFDENTRWTGVLQNLLGTNYVVVEEGQNGRTTVWDDPIEGDKNGLKHLPHILESQKPLNLVVLMLGTNDLKSRFAVSVADIAESQKPLLTTITQSGSGTDGGAPKILLMCPPPAVKLTGFADKFIGAEEKSQDMAGYYAAVAAEMNVPLINMGEHIVSSPIDGIHFEADQHAKMAAVLADKIKALV